MRYNVPVLSQDISPICWVVCAAMVQKYWQQRAGNDFDTTMLTGGASPLNSCIPGSSGGGFYLGLQDAGFQIYENPPYTMTDRHISALLSAHGPLVFTHLCLNFNYGPTRGGKVAAASPLAGLSHAVVITGIEAGRAFFNNPWGDKDVEIPAADMVASLAQAITVFRPLAYAVASPTPGNVIYRL